MAKSPLLNSSGAVSLTILSGGKAIAGSIQVVSVEINKAVNRISTATLVIVDGDMPNTTFPVSETETFKPGSDIIIQAGYSQKVGTIFTGVVIKHAIKFDTHNCAKLLIECKDKALAMTIGRKNANYIALKDSEIITQLISTYGLSATVDATDTSHKELVQYYCTDWDFMLARAEFNGLLVTIDADAVKVQAPKTDARPVLTVTYGTDIIDFYAELDARSQYQTVTSTAWDLSKLAIQDQEASPQALTGQGNITSATLAAVLGLKNFQLQSAVPLESTDLGAWAKARQLKSSLARIRGHLSVQGSAAINPGDLLELKGVGSRFNGKVFVSGVRHDINNGSWLTEVEFGMSSNWFTETHDLQAPMAAGVTAAVNGLQIGVVMKLDSDPDSQYRIQVSVPVMQASSDGVWARLASFYGSNTFGAYFIPEIGDEVVLGYFNNDPSYPVILGSLYSSKHTAPYELTAENNTKALITRSKLKFTFDDDKKVITLVTPQNNTIVISDDQKSILLQDQNGNKIELNQSGITLSSPQNLQINADGNITLNAKQNITLTSQNNLSQSGMNISCEAKTSLTVKGSVSAELSSPGQTTVKGAMVMIN